MDFLDVLRTMIRDFHEQRIDTGVRRRLDYELVARKAFVCIGVRRCGKSTLLGQMIEDLVMRGVPRENVLYVNFFDDRLRGLWRGEPGLVLEAYFSLFPEKKGTETIHCFFDEIHASTRCRIRSKNRPENVRGQESARPRVQPRDAETLSVVPE